jgi:hypothetical protein
MIIPPALLELEEVDLTSDTMDPLEWTVRKLVSIPKTYYWELDDVDPEALPVRLKVWHRSVATMGTIVRVTDRVGLSVANFLGLTTSGPFDYVTNTMTERDWEISRRTVAERMSVREQEQQEEGGGTVIVH